MRCLLPTPLLLLACGQAEPELPEARDGIPAAQVGDPQSGWTAHIEAGGALRLDGPAGTQLAVEGRVLPGVAFSPSGEAAAFAMQTVGPECDLFLLPLEEGAQPRALTDWPGAEDRPVFSPDGARVAFFSGRTGWASLWVLDLEGGEPRQLTNVGIEDQPRIVGQAPVGFVPPAQEHLAWTGEGIRWMADGRAWSVQP